MDDAINFIQSRPLIGYQMDGSHLNDVLTNLARQQQQLLDGQQQLHDRLRGLDEDVHEIRDHQKQLEAVIGELGGPEQLHHVRSRMGDLEQAMDRVMQNLDETKNMAIAAGQDADQAGRLADDANRAAQSLRDGVNSVAKDVDAVARQSEADRKELARTLSSLDDDRGALEQRMREAIREIQMRIESIEKSGSGAEGLRRMVEALSDRTDENFRSVEESARAVDAELSRQSGNIGSLRKDLGALDEKARAGLSSLSHDLDSKYQMLLDAFRQYEQGWSDLEEHMVKAGQLLANRTSRSPAPGSGMRR